MYRFQLDLMRCRRYLKIERGQRYVHKGLVTWLRTWDGVHPQCRRNNGGGKVHLYEIELKPNWYAVCMIAVDISYGSLPGRVFPPALRSCTHMLSV